MGNIADALEKAGVGLVDQKGDDSGGNGDGDSSGQESYPRAAPSEPWEERLNMIANDSAQAAESFRVLRSQILFPEDGRPAPRTIMVTSSASGEGKSMVSVNLALAIARGLDQYALLVDCDLRRPSLAPLLGLGAVGKRGLADYLRGEAEIRDLILKCAVQKMSLLPSGPPPVNPAELLSSGRMNHLVEELYNRYADRFVIFDSPPFQAAAESSVLSKAVEGVVLVVGYGRSDRRKVKAMVDSIGAEKVYGVVFNAMKENYLNNKLFESYSQYDQYYTAGKK
ncbi:polysaccharide biosynthesis tyrosine autokinase [Desulfopila sp. IMCC35008]|uniref:polysaccharide biosynthesis tyrosine autokinase n=1 Tax=Desulfopila sp. IMCC35008 TaxID=2653858 RepID=UPI0013D65B05|nr:polysaccharide biosynthesis tyrosine autokinase [Desulfopila sp. IMCC35008]